METSNQCPRCGVGRLRAWNELSDEEREVVQRLTQVRPETLGQASRVPGITPAAIAVLGAYLHRAASESHMSS